MFDAYWWYLFLCMGRSSDGRAKYDYRDMGKSIKIDDL